MTGINNNFLGRQIQIKDKQLLATKSLPKAEEVEQEPQTAAPAPTAKTEAALLQQSNYIAMLNKPVVSNEVKVTNEQTTGLKADSMAVRPEMEELKPIEFDESVIATTEIVVTTNASESAKMNAKPSGSTTTTTDRDSQGRPVRVTVVVEKYGKVVETKVTTYEYEGDSKTPSKTQTDTMDGNGELVNRLITVYDEDGAVDLTNEYKYENGVLVSRLATRCFSDGRLIYTDYDKYENGVLVSSLFTSYNIDQSVNYTDASKYENGIQVSRLLTYYNSDETVDHTIDYKFGNNRGIVSKLETYYRSDGTVSHTYEYKFKNSGTLLTKEVQYAEDGKTPLKETNYEYDDEGNRTKSTEKTYEYDNKGRLIKLTTNVNDLVNGTSSESVKTFTYDEEDDGDKIGTGHRTDGIGFNTDFVITGGQTYNPFVKVDFKLNNDKLKDKFIK